MFIYKITNILNSKVYIGQTVQKNVKMRWYRHLSNAKLGVDGYLYNSIRKNGKDNFKFEILVSCLNIDYLDELENDFIKQYNSFNKEYGYNLKTSGKQPRMNDEVKLKISKTVKEQYKNGRIPSNNTGNLPWNIGMTFEYKARPNLSKSLMGKRLGIPMKEETKRKLSISQKKWQESNNSSCAKFIHCVELDIYFTSAARAAKYFNTSQGCISNVCRKERKSYKGLTMKYVNSIPKDVLPNPAAQDAAMGNVK